MHWTNISLILVAGLNVGMALLIWLRNPKNKINITFALSVFSIGGWSLGEAMFREAPTVLKAHLWSLADHGFGPLVVIFFFLFTLYFPYQHKKLNLSFKLLILFSIVIAYLIILSPKLYLTSIILQPPNNDFILHPIGRTYYALFFLVYLPIAFYWLVKKYFQSQGVLRSNFLYIIFATGFIASFGTVFGVMIPLILGRNNPWYAPLFSIPMVIILAWFILLGDKKIVIK